MADPKHVVERHLATFNARDVDAAPWSRDAEFVAPNAAMYFDQTELLGQLGLMPAP